MSQNNEQPPHAWAIANFTTHEMRQVADKLRRKMSGIVLEGGQRNKKDALLMESVKYMAAACDHIDRLEAVRGPHIVHTSLSTDDDNMYLFGTDAMGRVWQYNFGAGGGWLLLDNNVSMIGSLEDDDEISH